MRVTWAALQGALLDVAQLRVGREERAFSYRSTSEIEALHEAGPCIGEAPFVVPRAQ